MKNNVTLDSKGELKKLRKNTLWKGVFITVSALYGLKILYVLMVPVIGTQVNIITVPSSALLALPIDVILKARLFLWIGLCLLFATLAVIKHRRAANLMRILESHMSFETI